MTEAELKFEVKRRLVAGWLSRGRELSDVDLTDATFLVNLVEGV